MTGKQSRVTELIRQKALRLVAMLRNEAIVAKQIGDEFDQQHVVTNFVKLCFVPDLLFFWIGFKSLLLCRLVRGMDMS